MRATWIKNNICVQRHTKQCHSQPAMDRCLSESIAKRSTPFSEVPTSSGYQPYRPLASTMAQTRAEEFHSHSCDIRKLASQGLSVDPLETKASAEHIRKQLQIARLELHLVEAEKTERSCCSSSSGARQIDATPIDSASSNVILPVVQLESCSPLKSSPI